MKSRLRLLVYWASLALTLFVGVFSSYKLSNSVLQNRNSWSTRIGIFVGASTILIPSVTLLVNRLGEFAPSIEFARTVEDLVFALSMGFLIGVTIAILKSFGSTSGR
ncbi:hypothetical protein OCA8868_02049 [Octadecabacter ascidiaceicola]|uniref:Uncharacterized protein n=1 Tax=Octadecabacter ascidiaceicola TaxID=1655543 RepID=A0A238K9Y2_9RHOB|nr:hypothetical protein OCA8868_02049 [Octadecabacter ascidiaceicola]